MTKKEEFLDADILTITKSVIYLIREEDNLNKLEALKNLTFSLATVLDSRPSFDEDFGQNLTEFVLLRIDDVKGDEKNPSAQTLQYDDVLIHSIINASENIKNSRKAANQPKVV